MESTTSTVTPENPRASSTEAACKGIAFYKPPFKGYICVKPAENWDHALASKSWRRQEGSSTTERQTSQAHSPSSSWCSSSWRSTTNTPRASKFKKGDVVYIMRREFFESADATAATTATATATTTTNIPDEARGHPALVISTGDDGVFEVMVITSFGGESLPKHFIGSSSSSGGAATRYCNSYYDTRMTKNSLSYQAHADEYLAIDGAEHVHAHWPVLSMRNGTKLNKNSYLKHSETWRVQEADLAPFKTRRAVEHQLTESSLFNAIEWKKKFERGEIGHPRFSWPPSPQAPKSRPQSSSSSSSTSSLKSSLPSPSPPLSSASLSPPPSPKSRQLEWRRSV